MYYGVSIQEHAPSLYIEYMYNVLYMHHVTIRLAAWNYTTYKLCEHVQFVCVKKLCTCTLYKHIYMYVPQ